MHKRVLLTAFFEVILAAVGLSTIFT
jgi:hypothetical protein